jgi:hypothetical protein
MIEGCWAGYPEVPSQECFFRVVLEFSVDVLPRSRAHGRHVRAGPIHTSSFRSVSTLFLDHRSSCLDGAVFDLQPCIHPDSSQSQTSDLLSNRCCICRWSAFEARLLGSIWARSITILSHLSQIHISAQGLCEVISQPLANAHLDCADTELDGPLFGVGRYLNLAYRQLRFSIQQKRSTIPFYFISLIQNATKSVPEYVGAERFLPLVWLLLPQFYG